MKEKVAIVTGSATGVGAATAVLLAEKGCNVVINYTRSKEEAMATAQLVEQHNVECIVFQADVSNDDECKSMVEAAIKKWGKIDYLVNNAGKTKFNPFENLEGLSGEDFLDIYSVNVVGPYQMIKAVVPYMKKQGGGAIVNDSSLAGINGVGSSIAYVTSKAALNIMTKSLAHVLGPEIRINTVAPGPIQTRWLKGGMGDEAYSALIEQAENELPLKQVATAEDVAETLVWFLEGAKLITGEVLIVDSGAHLGSLPKYSSSED
ncbi:MAG: SDR family oxidoreductase [Gammaproteobacteria bacterium]|jgi:3-oxoacyl-[acyl-carrier protein] reductase|nr:SDR family oxidoreductase [Gammaproteobacteria bacterium]MDC0188792.1 SDR family oxidoreductase [Gammaproteobacteria bacterium]|tara:strand:- start:2194 stop:2982 length:789 start_codon:yes stop_codon:yes gene_type:complete